METNIENIYAKLVEPFKPSELEWRGEPRGVDVKSMKPGEKCKVLVFTYIEARAVQNRLDQVVGFMNWRDEYRVGPAGGILCALSLCVNGVWLTKESLAENTQIEAIKGGESDAFKRAAYKWGIGRYLYAMPEKWCEAAIKGRAVVLMERPSLPAWAYPYDWKEPKDRPNEVVPMLSPAQQTAQTYREMPASLAGICNASTCQ